MTEFTYGKLDDMIDYHCTGDTTYFELHKAINYSEHELYLLRTYEGLW